MTATIECQTLVFGQAAGMTAMLFPPGNDTAIVPDSPIVLTEATDRHGVYTFAAPTVATVAISGVYQVDLYLSGGTKPFWSAWNNVPAAGARRCEDSYVAALLSMNVDTSGRVLLQPTQTGVTIPTVTNLTNPPNAMSLGSGTVQSASTLTNSFVLETALGNDNLCQFNSVTFSQASSNKQFTMNIISYKNAPTPTAYINPLTPFPVVLNNTWTYDIVNNDVSPIASGAYDDGAVWLNTNQSHTRLATVPNVDGVATNPTNIPQHAVTLLTSCGLNRVRMTPTSGFNMVENWLGYEIIGSPGAFVAFNGYDVTGAVFQNLTISGVTSAGNIYPAIFTGTGLNDAASGGTYTAGTTVHTYTVIIDSTGTPDTFKWQRDSGSFTTGVAIIGSAQALQDGVTITFTNTTGHTLTDEWQISAPTSGSASYISDAIIGVTTMYPTTFDRPKFLGTTFTAPATLGEWDFNDGVSLGGTDPVFTFAAVNGTSKIDFKKYSGSIGSLTLNSHCTCTIVSQGGGTYSIYCTGSAFNFYGIAQTVNLYLYSNEQVRIHGVVGSLNIYNQSGGNPVSAVVRTSGLMAITNNSACDLIKQLSDINVARMNDQTPYAAGSGPAQNLFDVNVATWDTQSATIDAGNLPIVSPTNIASALAGATIVLVSPLSIDGSILDLTTGDSYTAANGQNFKFNITGAPNLVGTVPHMRITGMSADFAVAPAVVSETQQIVFDDVLASATIGLVIGTYPYQIRFEDGFGNVATIIQGYATVRAGI